MIGELALYCFVVLVLTGVYLTFFFHASPTEVHYDGSYAPLRGLPMSEAYRSAIQLSFDVRAGLVMRQIHHWAALLFLASIVVHLARVFFTGAFRRPREINWMIGVTLLILAMVNGFAGYSLLDDQLSGTGLRIAYSIVLSIPLIGTLLASLLFGGEFPGSDILSRLFVIHILVLPALIGLLLTVHLAIVVRHKHTQFPGPGRCDTNVVGERLWPTLRGQGARTVLPHHGRPLPARGSVPDQPDLAVRAVQPGAGVGRLAARLVHGLARRRAADPARLGDPGLRLRGAQPVLFRCAASPA